ncbi:MAG: HAD family hydrolase [Candidatus Methylomirabilis sp.]|nr:HAD family hydrolase [Deltaproteobacteria bacterium]
MDEIIEYHRAHEGISRYRKFRHIHEKILGIEYTEAAGQKLGEEFSALVYEKVLNAPFVKGASEFLERHHAEYLMFIASGTPAEELADIVRARGIAGYFRGVYGSPMIKTEALRDIMRRHGLSGEEVVLVGDAESDRNAANEAGTHFIARVPGSGPLKNERHKIKDLSGLMKLMNGLGR